MWHFAVGVVWFAIVFGVTDRGACLDDAALIANDVYQIGTADLQVMLLAEGIKLAQMNARHDEASLAC
jgi:hypothetical protein